MHTRRHVLALGACGFLSIGGAARAQSVAGYEDRLVAGSTLRINAGLIRDDATTTASILALIEDKLGQIARVLPAQRLPFIRTVITWIEANARGDTRAYYHYSAPRMAELGIETVKVRCIEITNAAAFVGRSRQQPWNLLHELTHAYHHQVVGLDNRDIRAAYERARSAGLYRNVRRNTGRTVAEAYALTNEREYFAELTEAYFGENDFFPFVRSELAAYDPDGFQVVERLWNLP